MPKLNAGKEKKLWPTEKNNLYYNVKFLFFIFGGKKTEKRQQVFEDVLQ